MYQKDRVLTCLLYSPVQPSDDQLRLQTLLVMSSMLLFGIIAIGVTIACSPLSLMYGKWLLKYVLGIEGWDSFFKEGETSWFAQSSRSLIKITIELGLPVGVILAVSLSVSSLG